MMLPDQAKCYYPIFVRLDNSIRRFSGLTVSRTSGAVVDADQLTDYQACMALHLSLQLGIGLFLPIAILFAEELLSRIAFQRRLRPTAQPSLSPVLTTITHIALVPFQAAVGVQTVSLLLHYVGLWGAK